MGIGFDRESNAREKGFFGIFRSSGLSAISITFKRMLHEIEARNAIVDKIVHDTRKHAFEEFRIAHPPKFPCTHPNCYECFPNMSKLQRHLHDYKFHEKVDFEAAEVIHRVTAVENAFKGNQGRRLHANRLLFSIDLADLKPRLHNLSEHPYRPHLADVGMKREKQLRNGMLVLGADPKAGIRPIPISRNLKKQHRANCILPPVSTNINELHRNLSDFNKPNLGATLLEMIHCRDEQIDTVVVDVLGGRKEIRFEWKG